ncbi:MAG: nitroreductase family protein [Chloroflexi bacterium]|nr:nitroreductase family protein [Chloroflexota bacterium]
MENEKINWLISRRSIRRYLPDPMPDAIINNILTAATWAPSAHNRQPWRFVVMSSLQIKQKLAAAMGAKLRTDLEADQVPETIIVKNVGHSYERITKAPTLILLCLTMADMNNYPDDFRQHNEYLMAVQSSAMAAQNLLLAAHAHGLGACWLCAPLFCPDLVQQTLDLPLDWRPHGLITLGYPAETKSKERYSLATRVLFR